MTTKVTAENANAQPTDIGPLNLEEIYALACKGPTDIHEHLPLLRELAEKCNHVTEFGMRWATGSTLAFLAAKPRTLISWDIDFGSVISATIQALRLKAPATDWQPRVGDTLKIAPIEPTDLLFIDTLHTGQQLWRELIRHVDPRVHPRPVRKYLVFHDTETYGMKGMDGKEPGLRTAIRQFQKNHAFPHWRLTHELFNNNGLVVLEHVCADGHCPESQRVNGYCRWCALPAEDA